VVNLYAFRSTYPRPDADGPENVHYLDEVGEASRGTSSPIVARPVIAVRPAARMLERLRTSSATRGIPSMSGPTSSLWRMPHERPSCTSHSRLHPQRHAGW
jgi:hypothetical protein